MTNVALAAAVDAVAAATMAAVRSSADAGTAVVATLATRVADHGSAGCGMEAGGGIHATRAAARHVSRPKQPIVAKHKRVAARSAIAAAATSSDTVSDTAIAIAAVATPVVTPAAMIPATAAAAPSLAVGAIDLVAKKT